MNYKELDFDRAIEDAGFSNIEVIDVADKEKQLITAFLENSCL